MRERLRLAIPNKGRLLESTIALLRDAGLVFVSDDARKTFQGVFKLGSMSERKDDLARLPKLERLVVRRFMKPWTFRYDRARYLMRKQAPGQTMVEVRGEARYQYQQLKE